MPDAGTTRITANREIRTEPFPAGTYPATEPDIQGGWRALGRRTWSALAMR